MMRKSTAHVNKASTLLLSAKQERPRPTIIASCCWQTHLNALLRAFDSPLSKTRPVTRWTKLHPLRHRTYTTTLKTEPLTKKIPKIKHLPRDLEGPLGVFNISNIELAHLDLSIRKGDASGAWAQFNTLCLLNKRIPLDLCCSLYSLIRFAGELAKSQTVYSDRHSQLEDLLGYVETVLGESSAVLLSNSQVIPIPLYKLLMRAIAQRNGSDAWTIFMKMKRGENKRIKRIYYLKLIALIQKDSSLSLEECQSRMSLIAMAHCDIEESGRTLTASDILWLGKIYHLYSEGRLREGYTAVNAFINIPGTHDGIEEMIWQLLQLEQLDLATNIFDRTKEFIVHTEQMYVNFMRVYTRHRRCRGALWHFEKMLAMGTTPTLKSFNALLHTFSEQREKERACNMLDTMHSLGIVPDVTTYSEIMRVHGRMGEPRASVVYYDLMRRAGIKPNTYSFSIIIDAFAAREDIPRVIRWFEIMLENEVRPNEVIISCVMKAFQQQDDPNLAIASMQIAKHALASGIKFDLVLYTMFLKIHACTSGFSGILSFHSDMIKEHISPNVYTYNVLMDVCGKYGMYDTAQQIFELMKETEHQQPNTVTYTILMDLWTKARRPDKVQLLVDEFNEEIKHAKSSRLWVDPVIEEYL
ncbi:hypothetical protein BDF14DRAFT_1789902 [Spinellus fusiger]|nr:hypothetical protein BDF14DRAFT_1789902 [Spinellus fusiger]